MKFLSGDTIPKYYFSSYRYFEEGERHVSRICNEDVLLIVFSGTLRFSENGIKKEIHAGEYYFQEKGLYQSGDEISDSPKYYYIHFLGDFYEGDRGYLNIKGYFDINYIKKAVDKLEASRTSNAPPIEIHNSFLSVISALSSAKGTTDFANKIQKYVTDNIKEELTLDRLSYDFGYCKNYIIKIFKKEFDLTPHEYVTIRRIDLAKNLLISSDMSTEEIAEECGFVTYVNFYKAFVKREACSPKIFRTKARI